MVLLIAPLCFAGCDAGGIKTVPVTGRVTYNGNPVTEGMVTFMPASSPAGSIYRPATSQLQPDGSYNLRTFEPGDGVIPGEYAVAIVAFDHDTWAPPQYPGDEPDYTVPKKYVRPDTSGLEAVIPADASGPLEINFELEGELGD